jgi:hypothetical protein
VLLELEDVLDGVAAVEREWVRAVEDDEVGVAGREIDGRGASPFGSTRTG